MKVTTLDNLKELLELMRVAFGEKELAVNHRNTLNTYILDIDYDNELTSDTSAILGVGKLGTMILGKS